MNSTTITSCRIWAPKSTWTFWATTKTAPSKIGKELGHQCKWQPLPWLLFFLFLTNMMLSVVNNLSILLKSDVSGRISLLVNAQVLEKSYARKTASGNGKNRPPRRRSRRPSIGGGIQIQHTKYQGPQRICMLGRVVALDIFGAAFKEKVRLVVQNSSPSCVGA